MKCAISKVGFFPFKTAGFVWYILYTPPTTLLGRCYSDKISVQRITFNLRFTPK